MPTVLYRCPNPTNFLCPCGRVARELRRHGIEHETIRVPYQRRRRPQVEELTGQARVPVVVLDEQAIVDSRRIVEHLRWRAATG
ncbi:MAG TPA: glutathione S-transferase N-terminal domain-containing protein [Solirubrobacteraceae bacterium]|nr:glutathione S-transferase N-terminal domain-containing protein [Solirubrobacteraceae bacterium]